MSEGLAFLSVCFPSLFSIVDPIAAVPIFLALVGKETREVQRRTAIRATLTMLVVLTIFAIGGTVIFKFFGISIPAFKIAGGALLFGVAFEMLHAKQSAVRTTDEENQEAENKHEAGIIPIGIPMLSGPGAIATAMMWASRAHVMQERLALYISIGILSLITLIAFTFATSLTRILGKTGIKIATRIMGLILAATAAQFVIDGVTEAFPALVGGVNTAQVAPASSSL